jgi:hypothetical protein
VVQYGLVEKSLPHFSHIRVAILPWAGKIIGNPKRTRLGLDPSPTPSYFILKLIVGDLYFGIILNQLTTSVLYGFIQLLRNRRSFQSETTVGADNKAKVALFKKILSAN